MKLRRVLTVVTLVLVLVEGGGLSAQEVTVSHACPATIAVARFSDTEHLPAESRAAISCIAHYGITAGTTSSTFSPAIPVSRSQLARFLVRTAGALSVELPDGEVSPFLDLDEVNDDGRRSISRLWELGVTRGTASGLFSPEKSVSRRQMALFLSRLLKWRKFEPAPTPESRRSGMSRGSLPRSPMRSDTWRVSVLTGPEPRTCSNPIAR